MAVAVMFVAITAFAKRPVIPTFEIIATIASASKDKDYSSVASVAKLRPWVQAAQRAGVYVVLDAQPGRSDFLSQAKRYASLLKMPNVGVAHQPHAHSCFARKTTGPPSVPDPDDPRPRTTRRQSSRTLDPHPVPEEDMDQGQATSGVHQLSMTIQSLREGLRPRSYGRVFRIAGHASRGGETIRPKRADW